jgi:haloacetate dehalogenase
MIHGSCSDYRAAASVDLEHDAADIDKKSHLPHACLLGWRWPHAQAPRHRRRLAKAMQARRHRDPARRFFIDQFPDETVQTLAKFSAG